VGLADRDRNLGDHLGVHTSAAERARENRYAAHFVVSGVAIEAWRSVGTAAMAHVRPSAFRADGKGRAGGANLGA
jgi:hypothetical protein